MKKTITVGTIVVLAIAGAAAWLWHHESSPRSAVAEYASLNLPAGMSPYSNPQYHFSLLYPSFLQMSQFQSGDAYTVAFQDPQTKRGFQVYVVPYSGDQITKDEFQKDIPSGVMINPTNIVVAGAPAIMFLSTDATMGDTREVWFIKGGYLYEVTTYKQLDAWLSSIMQSWQFI
jgi:hypothetical protein